jgi:hypothetical protein
MARKLHTNLLTAIAAGLAVAVMAQIASANSSPIRTQYPGSSRLATNEASVVPAKLVGCWSRNVTSADYTRAGTGGFPTGVWSMTIKKGGSVALFTPGSGCGGSFADFRTSLSVAAGRLTFNSVPVCTSKGVYSWKVSGKSLTLRAVADKQCAPRIGLFTGVWKRK